MLSFDIISAYRQHTFRTAPGRHLHQAQDAIDFVDQSGFIFFWPITGIVLPSLWVAAAGDRPVADEHDDPGHVTWSWKDELLGKGLWYYARILRHRNTIVSLMDIPYFYALSPNYGSPEDDYLEQYQSGKMTLEAKSIFEALLREGPLDTLSLRRISNMNSKGGEGRFNRALDQLQIELKILPIGIAPVGPWRYAFIYDLTHRAFPHLIDQARPISEPQARQHLLMRYMKMLGATRQEDIQKLFSWSALTAEKTISHLVSFSQVEDQVRFSDQPGEWLMLKSFIG